MVEHKTGNEIDPLTQFNEGGVVIVKTPYGVDVVLQKQEGHVRSGFVGDGSLTPAEFRKKISDAGGHMAIIQDALTALGVTQKVENGSGVLQNVEHHVEIESVLKRFFNWKKPGR